MGFVFGEFAKISNIGNVPKVYEDNRWTRDEVLEPQIAIESVFATQALVMQLLHRQERSVLHGDKKHGFAALNNIHSNEDEFYDGSLEEYLSCRIAKVDYDQWKMRVRFRQNELSQEELATSYIDDFSFDWLRNGNLQAWYGNYRLTAIGVPDVTYEEWQGIRPIDESMVEQLHERMQAHMFSVTAAKALHASRAYSR